ncbi:MAG: hypothetical protein KY453_12925, partial [Gemmatimonadetes bacterium]|nr:hypothetical protein [Gemmatimonadota bacterium]
MMRRFPAAVPTPFGLALVGLAVLTAVMPAAAPAQDAAALARRITAAVTVDELMAHAREITRHERPSGSPGENAAIDYIVRTLEDAGVPVEVHEFRAFTSDPVRATVSVPGTGVAPEAITVSFSASAEGLEAPLVDVGGLGDVPGLEPGTGERIVLEGAAARPDGDGARLPDGFPDVRGRVVLVSTGPGDEALVPPRVRQALAGAEVVVGLQAYIDRVRRWLRP